MSSLPTIGGPIPTRSPYRHGRRVQLHGYAGYPAGPRRAGWRGIVIGGFGANALHVLTDNGSRVVENWADLTADGQREQTAARCNCCNGGTA